MLKFNNRTHVNQPILLLIIMDHNIKAYYEALLLKKIREGDDEGEGGEGKFGLTPFSVDPNHVLTQTPQNISNALLGPKAHPLLKGQQFSGIDKKITPNPQENSTAQELYPQLRLNNQLNLQQQQKKKPPRLMR